MFKLLVDSLFDCGVVALKSVGKILNLNVNTIDFNNFFKVVDLKNNQEDYPELLGRYSEKFYDCYKFKAPVGIGIKEFRKVLNPLSIFLKINENDLRFEIGEGFDIELRILKQEFQEVDFSILGKQNRLIHIEDFKIPLGLKIENQEIIYWDMINDADAHMYVAGTTGSGKSNQVRVILTYLTNTKTHNDVEFCLFNTKRLDLKEFQDIIHTKNFVHGKDGALETIEQMVKEMKMRYELLDKWGYSDWKELRKQKKLPYKLIVIEELAEFKGFHKWHNAFNLLLQQGRAAGLVVIATTQLPSKDIMDNEAKQCFNTTIAQKCKDEIRASIVIYDENANLQKLKGKGHSKLYSSDECGVEYQSFKIKKEQIEDIVLKNKKSIFLGETNFSK